MDNFSKYENLRYYLSYENIETTVMNFTESKFPKDSKEINFVIICYLNKEDNHIIKYLENESYDFSLIKNVLTAVI